MTIERLKNPSAGKLNALTDLWEASVRATHDFLAPEDIAFFRQMVRQEAFGGFAAFAGIDGDMLEMLFVAPKARGKGVGRQLVEYLVRERGIRQVDVNEQNTQAAGFYARLGFRVTGRDATDPSGRPYPILHLSLGETPQRIVPIPNLQTDRVDVDFESEPTGDEGK